MSEYKTLAVRYTNLETGQMAVLSPTLAQLEAERIGIEPDAARDFIRDGCTFRSKYGGAVFEPITDAPASVPTDTVLSETAPDITRVAASAEGDKDEYRWVDQLGCHRSLPASVVDMVARSLLASALEQDSFEQAIGYALRCIKVNQRWDVAYMAVRIVRIWAKLLDPALPGATMALWISEPERD